jgi:hypothetical protein
MISSEASITGKTQPSAKLHRRFRANAVKWWSKHGAHMWQLREALLRQRKARSGAKHAAEPLPRRWAELVLYLEEIERTERTKSDAGGRSPRAPPQTQIDRNPQTTTRRNSTASTSSSDWSAAGQDLIAMGRRSAGTNNPLGAC